MAFNQTFVFGADFEPVAVAAHNVTEKVRGEMKRLSTFWQDVWDIDENAAASKIRRMVAMAQAEVSRAAKQSMYDSLFGDSSTHALNTQAAIIRAQNPYMAVGGGTATGTGQWGTMQGIDPAADFRRNTPWLHNPYLAASGGIATGTGRWAGSATGGIDPVADASRQQEEILAARRAFNAQMDAESDKEVNDAKQLGERLKQLHEERLTQERLAYAQRLRENKANDNVISAAISQGRNYFGGGLSEEDLAKLQAWRRKGQEFKREIDQANESAGRMKGIWHNVGFAIEDALVVGTMKGMEFSDVLRASANNLSTIAMLAAPDKGMGSLAFTILPAATVATVALYSALETSGRRLSEIQQKTDAYRETLKQMEIDNLTFGISDKQKRDGSVRRQEMLDFGTVQQMEENIAEARIAQRDRQKVLDLWKTPGYTASRYVWDKFAPYLGGKTIEQDEADIRAKVLDAERVRTSFRLQAGDRRGNIVTEHQVDDFMRSVRKGFGGKTDIFGKLQGAEQSALDLRRAEFDAWQAGERARIQGMEADPAVGRGHFRVQEARDRMEAEAAEKKAALEKEEAKLKKLDAFADAANRLADEIGRMVNNGKFGWMLGMPGGN